MTTLNYMKNRMNLLLGGSINETIEYFMIGTGSSTITVADTTLLTAVDRQLITSHSYTSLVKDKFQGNWNSTTLSGLNISEFGLCTSGATTTGSMWTRTVIPTITFDGTNELLIEEELEVF